VNDQPGAVRVLECLGRYQELPDEAITLELTGGEYDITTSPNAYPRQSLTTSSTRSNLPVFSTVNVWPPE